MTAASEAASLPGRQHLARLFAPGGRQFVVQYAAGGSAVEADRFFVVTCRVRFVDPEDFAAADVEHAQLSVAGFRQDEADAPVFDTNFDKKSQVIDS